MDYIQLYLDTKNIEYLHLWVEENHKLLRSIVHKTVVRHRLYSIDEDDLFSDAVLFFYKAVDGYNPTRAKFSTYLFKVLTNELVNHCKALIRADFAGRVPTINIDGTIDSVEGDAMAVAEVITATDPKETITYTMRGLLQDYVRTHKDERTQLIYDMYVRGFPLVEIAKQLHVSKQYISITIINLANELREEWRTNE
jgi:RNA polymerase sigma factor (sigma-70 family)